MSRVVERNEDMSQVGKLVLYQQADGDIIVAVHEERSDGLVEPAKTVEFCTRSGGGRSPRTLEALNNLMHAMELDNSGEG